jgi:hypothetical protein
MDLRVRRKPAVCCLADRAVSFSRTVLRGGRHLNRSDMRCSKAELKLSSLLDA